MSSAPVPVPVVAALNTDYKRSRDALRARQSAKLDDYLKRYPTEHPHLMILGLDTGITVEIKCPGHEHCGLWYNSGPGRPEGGICGLQLECSEVGSELLEWQVGPPFLIAETPVRIGFTWSNCGEDDPPEIDWWPLPGAGI